MKQPGTIPQNGSPLTSERSWSWFPQILPINPNSGEVLELKHIGPIGPIGDFFGVGFFPVLKQQKSIHILGGDRRHGSFLCIVCEFEMIES